MQQLGRGLRKADGKDKLVVLDFIGNHHSFLHKPQALLAVGTSYRQLAAFARKVERGELALPDGCFINYDLQLIDFLKSLDGDGVLPTTRRSRQPRPTPSLAEFHRSGANVGAARKQFGSWFELVLEQGDLDADEALVLAGHKDFLREVETTSMTKSYKMVLLEAFQELDGWHSPAALDRLAERSWQVLQRRRSLLGDLPDAMRAGGDALPSDWLRYWQGNPVKPGQAVTPKRRESLVPD